MSDITFTLDFTGTPNRDDRAAAVLVIDATNAKLALEDPPGTPWPKSNDAEIKASYLAIQEALLTTAHASYAEQAALQEAEDQNVQELWEAASDAQRAAAITALQT